MIPPRACITPYMRTHIVVLRRRSCTRVLDKNEVQLMDTVTIQSAGSWPARRTAVGVRRAHDKTVYLYVYGGKLIKRAAHHNDRLYTNAGHRFPISETFIDFVGRFHRTSDTALGGQRQRPKKSCRPSHGRNGFVVLVVFPRVRQRTLYTRVLDFRPEHRLWTARRC